MEKSSYMQNLRKQLEDELIAPDIKNLFKLHNELVESNDKVNELIERLIDKEKILDEKINSTSELETRLNNKLVQVESFLNNNDNNELALYPFYRSGRDSILIHELYCLPKLIDSIIITYKEIAVNYKIDNKPFCAYDKNILEAITDIHKYNWYFKYSKLTFHEIIISDENCPENYPIRLSNFVKYVLDSNKNKELIIELRKCLCNKNFYMDIHESIKKYTNYKKIRLVGNHSLIPNFNLLVEHCAQNNIEIIQY